MSKPFLLWRYRVSQTLHPRTEILRKTCQIRQAEIQTAQQHRDHVRKAQGLEACRNTLRQMSNSLLLGHLSRSNPHLLAMGPKSSIGVYALSQLRMEAYRPRRRKHMPHRDAGRADMQDGHEYSAGML